MVRRTRNYEYGTNNRSTVTLVNESWASIDGLQTGSNSFGLTYMSATTVNQGAIPSTNVRWRVPKGHSAPKPRCARTRGTLSYNATSFTISES